MFHLISHRANIIKGRRVRENSIKATEYAIKELDLNVELDVIFLDKELYLGHDAPEYRVKRSWLISHSDKLWLHAKSIRTFDYLINLGVKCFFHNVDDVTPVINADKVYLWTYPGKEVTSRSILVLPEIGGYTKEEIQKAAGICTDMPLDYGYLLGK